MKALGERFITAVKIAVGCALFGLGFDLFLIPNRLNAGGLSGLSMVILHLTGFGSVGLMTGVMNIPLFALGGIRIGKNFLLFSLTGAALSAGFIDLFSQIPAPATDPLIGGLYGGGICGLGLGIVFATGGSTGGSDIIVRLMKQHWPSIPIGTIIICFDATVAILTGVVFRDLKSTLYSGIAIGVSGFVIDAVVYKFDYSKIALIITGKHTQMAQRIAKDLKRGATFLNGEGSYSGEPVKVVLTAVRRPQLAELKALAVEIDPDAFIIVQEAHQVLGDGFLRYTKDSL